MSHPQLGAMKFPFQIGVIVDILEGMAHHSDEHIQQDDYRGTMVHYEHSTAD